MKFDQNKNYRVNWIDGMKINKNHFIELEHSMMSLISDSELKDLNPYNYGLLPNFKEGESAIDVTISVDGQSTIEVALNTCHAVTLGGHYIQLSSETKDLLNQTGYILKHQFEIDKKDKEWYIVLTVNPYSRIPVGNADPGEDPPRHPHVLPEYKLDVLPKKETSKQELGLFHITIGKVTIEDGKPIVDANFIPPSRSVQSHEDLKFIYSELSAFLNQMEAYSLHIIQKIHQKEQANDLAQMALVLSQSVMNYLNAIIGQFRLQDKYAAPVLMISRIINLARVMKSSLDVYVGTGKEDFLNYLTDWCDLNQGAFENILVQTIELEYVHNDINSALTNISEFTRLMLSLFKKLNELDYIGKKQESGLFVKEEVVDKPEVKSRRSFLLD